MNRVSGQCVSILMVLALLVLDSICPGYPLASSSGLSVTSTRKLPQEFILVVADYFTKWTEAYTLPNQETATVAHKLVEELFFRFSLPHQLHSDQGRQFESTIIKEACSLQHKNYTVLPTVQWHGRAV